MNTVLVIPMGPLIWLYVQSNLNPAFRVSRQHRIHFYPVLLDLLPYITVFIFDIGLLAGVVSKEQRLWISDSIDTYNVYADIPRWMSITVYCWLSYRYIHQYKRQQPDIPESTNRWLQQFLLLFLCFQGIWLLYLVPYIIPASRGALLHAVGWYPIFVPLAVLIYWLGLKGYLVTHRPGGDMQQKTMAPASRLPEATGQQLARRLQKAMEEDRLYLDPSLNVNLLAEHTGIAAKTVSAVLNQHLDKSFSTFVNEYRVEAFKKRVLEQDSSHLTIPGIAMECGFSSAATFQRIFKQLTGMPPSRFIQEAKPADPA